MRSGIQAIGSMNVTWRRVVIEAIAANPAKVLTCPTETMIRGNTNAPTVNPAK